MSRLAVVVVLAGACGRAERVATSGVVVEASLDGGTLHMIELPQDPPELRPGGEVFVAACTVCHSARYITSQPRFSRTVWKAEVTKMMTLYGAPVRPAEIPAIVDYLVLSNGKELP